MKQILLIIVVSIFLVLGASLLMFNLQGNGFAGFAIYNDSSESTMQKNQTIVTKEMALVAINESEQIIKEMQENNFSIIYMNDTLIEAKKTFEQAQYAKVLRGAGDFTEDEKTNARRALNLINWKAIDYSSVVKLTDVIKQKREQAFLINDQIYIMDNKIKKNYKAVAVYLDKNKDLNTTFIELFGRAKISFSEDRYEEAEDYLLKAQESYESSFAESSILVDLRRGLLGFVQRYWFYILIVLILLSLSGYYGYRRFEKKLLMKKIRKMKAEEQVLDGLMRRTQEERFKENKISGLVYNIRMGKYNERLQEIKEELPVLEKKFGKLTQN